jgi:NTE family protein
MSARAPVIGLALGSGSARGWAHVGIIQELEKLGIQPQVVAGTSIGALVGAVYVTGQLDEFSDWVQSLTMRDVFGLLDISFSGGVMKGEKLFNFFREQHRNPDIESLEKKFVSVATEMKSGREIWIRKGPILTAARASCALPGLFSPVQLEDRWMLDGGLVNPVPVSACRALGADIVIAVNLNAQLVGTHMPRHSRAEFDKEASKSNGDADSLWNKFANYFVSDGDNDDAEPGMLDVMSASINIMQDRITRSRMAGDPAEISLLPQLEDFALMDFHRAKEAIEEGRNLVQRHQSELLAWTGLTAL